MANGLLSWEMVHNNRKARALYPVPFWHPKHSKNSSAKILFSATRDTENSNQNGLSAPRLVDINGDDQPDVFIQGFKVICGSLMFPL